MEQALFQGQQLYQLIPQRPPIVMVDKLWWATDTEAETGLTITADNLFFADGHLREPGLIEHIAQSAAAFAGYDTFKAGLPPRLGFIGEIKKCLIHALPTAEDVLRTHLRVLGTAAGVTLVAAQTTNHGGQQVAECQMKIFIKND